MSRDIRITPNLGSTGSTQFPKIDFRGLSPSFISLKVDDDGTLRYTGTYGTLLNISDSKDGLLHSVNDISGLPILSVYSYDYVQMGKWDKYSLVVNSDRVGVGLTSPSIKFHIYDTTGLGAFRLQDGTEAAGYVLTSDANGVATWQPGGGGGITGTGSSNYVPYWTGASSLSSTSSIYDDGDRVGIGTNAPGSKLSVVTTGTDGVSISNGTYNVLLSPDSSSTLTEISTTNIGYLFSSTNGYHRIGRSSSGPSLIYVANSADSLQLSGEVAGTPHIHISSTGSVGINTTSPISKLDVGGNVRIIGDINDNSAYALRVYNSNPSDIFSIVNDGSITINGGNGFGGTFEIHQKATGTHILTVYNNSYSKQMLTISDNGSAGSLYLGNGILQLDAYGGGVGINISPPTGGTLLRINCTMSSVDNVAFTGFDNGGFYFTDNGGGDRNPRFYMQDTTTATRVTISASGSSFFNGGKVSMTLLPTSNAGLSTGDLYVDTAANILSNGDLVVGWKV